MWARRKVSAHQEGQAGLRHPGSLIYIYTVAAVLGRLSSLWWFSIGRIWYTSYFSKQCEKVENIENMCFLLSSADSLNFVRFLQENETPTTIAAPTPHGMKKKRKFIRLFCCCFTNGLQFNSAAFGRLPCTRSSSTLVLCPRGNLVNSTIGNFAAHNRNSVRILFFISTYCVHAVEIIRKCPRLNIIQVVQQAHPCFHWVSPQVFVWLGHCFAHALVRCSFRTASNNVKRAV